MNTVEQEKLISELRAGVNIEENLKVVNSLVSSANSFKSIDEFINKHKRIERYFRKVSQELSNDQCFSYSSHVCEMIERLIEIVDQEKDNCHEAIYGNLVYEDYENIAKAIETLVNIKNKMNF